MDRKKTYKLVFVGAPGSGKSTCIGAVSDISVISTDVACTDGLAAIKETTTVAMDYGEMSLGDDERLLLYGLPGQSRFTFMFDTVAENLAGVVVLIDASSAAPLVGLEGTLRTYAGRIGETPFVAAINKVQGNVDALREQVAETLRRHGLVGPLIVVDARRREDMALIFDLVFLCAEYSDV